jgi:hypothetical protein
MALQSERIFVLETEFRVRSGIPPRPDHRLRDSSDAG